MKTEIPGLVSKRAKALLDQKTRKSHWSARLDFVQSASGLFLGNADRVSPAENGRFGVEIGRGFLCVGWPDGNRALMHHVSWTGQTLEIM